METPTARKDSLVNAYIVLILAVLAEVIALTAMRFVDGVTKPLPILVVVLAYGLSFYGLYVVLKSLPLGITYAIWAGLGTVGTILVGMILFKEKPDSAALVGMTLIMMGVGAINLFSGSATG